MRRPAWRLAAAALLAAPPAVAQTDTARHPSRVLYSDDPQIANAQRRYGWADAVVTDSAIHVSGVIAATRPGETSPEAAYVRAFERIGGILKRAGASWADVVEVRSYHTDPAAQFELFAAVKRRYLPAPDPAWTAVGVTRLLQPTGLVEIAVTARPRVRR